jgi:hypothetical protein
MKYSTFTLLLCLLMNLAQAQCNAFFPMKEKVKYQYDHFDKKEKLSLRTTQTFKDVKGSGNSMTATMVQEVIDVKKEKVMATTEAEWACEDGTLHFAINNMTLDNSQQTNAASGVTMDVTGDKMDIPSSFDVGQKLKDLTYNVKMAMSGMSLMNRTFKVTDRKVESVEQVTTPAGTFECYKLTYTTTSQGGIGSGTMKSISWFAKNVGMVKSETFSENGKLMSRQILSKIEK